MATWFSDNWRTLTMILMGSVSLLMLRNFVQSSAAATPTAAPDSANTARTTDDSNADDDVDHEDDINSLKNRFQQSGPSLRQELVEVVREDPDSAANVLRTWIENAA